MARGFGLSEAIGSITNAPVSFVGSVVTLLGDAGTLLAVALGAYWFGLPTDSNDSTGGAFDRQRGALVIALALGALSLATVLKTTFALPRPPGATLTPTFGSGIAGAVVQGFVDFAKSASGYGFPSGHAIAATTVYGAVAFFATRVNRRWSIAAVLIALVGLSRVVLGVHYAIDVLVGSLAGFGFLVVALRVVGATRGTPKVKRGFALAVFLSVLAVVLTTALEADPRDGVTLLGVSAGALGAWIVLDAPSGPVSPAEGAVTVVIGLAVVGVPGVFAYVLDPVLPVELLMSAAVGVAAIGTPHLTRIGARRFESVRSAIDPETQNVSR